MFLRFLIERHKPVPLRKSTILSLYLILNFIVESATASLAFGQLPRDRVDADVFYVERFRGQPRTCSPDLGGLRQALIRHAANYALFEELGTHDGDISSLDPGGPLLRNDFVRKIENAYDDYAFPALGFAAMNLDRLGKTALLIYDYEIYPGSYSICSWVVNRSGQITATKTPLSAKIDCDSPLSVLLRRALNVEAMTLDPLPNTLPITTSCANLFDPSGVKRLLDEVSSALVPPDLRKALLAGDVDRLAVLTVADIANLPFWVFPIGEKRLVDYASVSVVPDLKTLLEGQQSSTLSDAVIVGNPTGDLAGAKTEAIYASEMLKSRFPRLKVFTKDIGRDSLLPILRIPSGELLYFATHGYSQPGGRLSESYLSLSGGDTLRGSDILSLDVTGSEVIMSACQTALGKAYGGGTFGLPRAWYKGGARRVVMSLWDLPDDATRELMAIFVDNLSMRKDTESSLVLAIREMSKRYQDKPGLWAGFAIFGLPEQR